MGETPAGAVEGTGCPLIGLTALPSGAIRRAMPTELRPFRWRRRKHPPTRAVNRAARLRRLTSLLAADMHRPKPPVTLPRVGGANDTDRDRADRDRARQR